MRDAWTHRRESPSVALAIYFCDPRSPWQRGTNENTNGYQELARRVGPEQMQRYLDSLHYGNRELSGGIDQFWLSGGLAISSVEQVNFLERFYFGRLGLSDAVTTITKELLDGGNREVPT